MKNKTFFLSSLLLSSILTISLVAQTKVESNVASDDANCVLETASPLMMMRWEGGESKLPEKNQELDLNNNQRNRDIDDPISLLKRGDEFSDLSDRTIVNSDSESIDKSSTVGSAFMEEGSDERLGLKLKDFKRAAREDSQAERFVLKKGNGETGVSLVAEPENSARDHDVQLENLKAIQTFIAVLRQECSRVKIDDLFSLETLAASTELKEVPALSAEIINEVLKRKEALEQKELTWKERIEVNKGEAGNDAFDQIS